MKYNRTILFLISIFFTSNAYCQNTKHSVSSAKIKYKLTHVSEKGTDSKPLEYSLYIKKDMSRVEMESEKGKITMISDNLADIGYMLMDNSGKKIAMKMSRNAMMKNNGVTAEPKVQITRESKTIAGYNCYKAIITSQTKDGEKIYDVWFTNDIKGNYSYDTKITELNGLMMEFEWINDGMTYQMVATSVEPDDNLSDDLFKVPNEYQIMDMTNFQGGKTK